MYSGIASHVHRRPDKNLRYSQRNIPELTVRLAQHGFRRNATVRSLQDLLHKVVDFVHDQWPGSNKSSVIPNSLTPFPRFSAATNILRDFIEKELLPQIITLNERRLFSYVEHRAARICQIFSERYLTNITISDREDIRSVLEVGVSRGHRAKDHATMEEEGPAALVYQRI
ncbi:hypothetical protein BDN72DRAFT_152101 [Pluteus cervinus]|uniref:Uncharacterized protein n=1 Tax=Pluteus cervinus TaxID=181527 RepID=A0ACD3B6Q4_9AGAR|nr:hypothetical protein BDN72DRAFT_152101 [Pluteus cervinus]